MTGQELRCGLCTVQGQVEFLGVNDSGETMCRNISTGAAVAFDRSTMEEQPWETIEAVVSGRRSPRIMRQYSRIVGYFSELGNWNKFDQQFPEAPETQQ